MFTSSNIRTAIKTISAGLGVITALLVSAVILGQRVFSRLVRREVETLYVKSSSSPPDVVTQDMIEKLPAPVQRYMRYTGVVGKPFIRTVHLKQKGTMRPSPDGRAIPLNAEQYYTVDPPGFVWDGTMHVGPIPLARARDMYHAGSGQMLIKAGSIYTMADAFGDSMDQGAMMRYLSEMIWFPTAYLGTNVSFRGIDDYAAWVTLSDHGRSVSGIMYFDDLGRLTDFLAERYRMVDGKFELTPWSTPVTRYGEFEGLMLPVRGKAVWKLREGDFEYIDFKVTELEFNVPPNADIEARKEREAEIGTVSTV